MSDGYPYLVLAPYAGIVANVLSHVIISGVFRVQRYMTSLLAGFIAGFACLVGVAVLGLYVDGGRIAGADAVAYLLLDLMTYVALGYGYFHFVNINLASLRIRVLREIADAPDGLSRDQILSRYNSDEIIANRLTRLVQGRHLVAANGKYLLGENPTFLILFRLFDTLKRVVLGRGHLLINRR